MIDLDKINKELSEYNLWMVKDALVDNYWITDGKKEMVKLNIESNFLDSHSIDDLIFLASNIIQGKKVVINERDRHIKRGFANFYEGN